MAIRYDRSDVKQTTTGFRGPLMVQSLTSAKSKFLSLSRSYSDGRGQHMNFEEFEVFCEAYQKSFQLIHNIRLPIVKINTAKRCSKEIHNLFCKVFYEK